jgi:hypothetical protein
VLTVAGLLAIAKIVGGIIPVGGAVLYGLGVLHPLKTKATWNRTRWKPDDAKSEEFAALVVRIRLKNRKKSAQTLNNLALIDDPGWPRRLRGARSEVQIVPFTEWHGDDPENPLELQGGDARTVAAVLKGNIISGGDAASIAKALAAVALPFERTRLLIQMSDRNFYAKLVHDSIPAASPPPKSGVTPPPEPRADVDDAKNNVADAAKGTTSDGHSEPTG